MNEMIYLKYENDRGYFFYIEAQNRRLNYDCGNQNCLILKFLRIMKEIIIFGQNFAIKGHSDL